MSPTAAHAVIIDYNGVIGRQPSALMWRRLATLAEWPPDQLDSFGDAFWAPREAYNAGELSDLAYWAEVLGHHPSPRWLRTLRTADTAMWIRTDPDVLAILSRARAAGLPMVLLSSAPHFLADVLDATDWRRELMTDAVYSARKCSSRSVCLMRHRRRRSLPARTSTTLDESAQIEEAALRHRRPVLLPLLERHELSS
ncbi:hypothetical protein [Streptomyces coerulescens]|uniref:Uncharacterized protein n=1 Tax=Streptomyces coerulescens TaxID=29304 RepID=A0ABW0CV11_STRCD